VIHGAVPDARGEVTLLGGHAELDDPDTVLDAIRGHGLRVSTARRIVVRALFEAGRPVRASELADGLGGRLPTLDRASVYRNLDVLQRLGVIRCLHTGDRPGHYALATRDEREYLACDRCGALLEADPGDLDAARAAIREQFGYEPRFTHFPIVGRCPDCAPGAG
jgi:Fur family ferric uptake transcriptional regulator